MLEEPGDVVVGEIGHLGFLDAQQAHTGERVAVRPEAEAFEFGEHRLEVGVFVVDGDRGDFLETLGAVFGPVLGGEGAGDGVAQGVGDVAEGNPQNSSPCMHSVTRGATLTMRRRPM